MIEISVGDPRYPARLRDLRQPPDRLWVLGELPDQAIPTVAVVGTRRLTAYGGRVAREIAGGLASAGAVVVSGLAQGIDSTAHGAALAAGGRTIAVLGEGLLAFERTGPIRRRKLAEAIRQRGALVSEYALDVRGKNWTFPRRNATIAALSDVVVVVEAPLDSGALITADRALELRRPLFAAAGPFGAPTWRGSGRYIADGRAQLLMSTAEVAEALGLVVPIPGRVEHQSTARSERVLELLATGAADADAIAAGLGVPSSAVPTVIAEMLLAGTISATGDGRFARR